MYWVDSKPDSGAVESVLMAASPDVDPWLIDRAIGKQYRAREADAGRGAPKRAHRERMVRRIDATERDGGEVKHGV